MHVTVSLPPRIGIMEEDSPAGSAGAGAVFESEVTSMGSADGLASANEKIFFVNF